MSTGTRSRRGIADRLEFLRGIPSNGQIADLPMVCTKGDRNFFSVSSNFYPETYGPAGNGTHIVTLCLPASTVGAVAGTLESVGDALSALYALWLPPAASWELSTVLFTNYTLPTQSPLQKELGRLGFPKYKQESRIDSMELPTELGWVNYWSPLTCKRLGFPDADRDTQLLSLSKKTPAGSWLVKLTPEPIDLTKSADVAALKSAYERFDVLDGGLSQ